MSYKKGKRYYYTQIGSGAKIKGTYIGKGIFRRDKKVAGVIWHEKVTDIRRKLIPIK